VIRIVQLINDNREIQRVYDSPHPLFGPAPYALLEGFESLADQAEIHVVSCLQRLPERSPQKLAENVFFHPLHVPRSGWMRSGYAGCILAVRRKVREIAPEIVHGQGSERDCAICAAHAGCTAVITLHGVMSVLYPNLKRQAPLYYAMARALEKYSVKRVAGVICISDAVESAVGSIARKTWRVPNAIRGEFLKPDHGSIRRASSVPHFVNVGLISSLKRQRELLDILMPLRARFTFKMTFVGRLDTESSYGRSFAEALGQARARYGDFEHVPSLNQAELRETLDSADALLHFSKEESFCLVLAEARARQLAVFTTKVGAADELCASSRENCFVYPVDGSSEMEAGLGAWLARRAFLGSRPAAPDEIVASKMSPSVVAARHLEVYAEALARSGTK